MRMMYQRLWPTLLKPGLVIKDVSHARIHKASATGVSEEFTFHVYTKRNSAYLARICRHWDISGVYRESHESDKASFMEGDAFFGQTRAYVEDCNNAFRIWFRDRQAFQALDAEMDARDQNRAQSLYRFNYDDEFWESEGTYRSRSPENLVGCEDILDTIRTVLNKYQDQHEILQKLDENKPLNFLLYGPPGVGKTSLIMALASLKSWPIYVVNASGLKVNNLHAALSPRRSHDDTRMRVLLFEDFDRFLQHDQIDLVMTQVLNALDGVDNTDSRTVRVFTGNDCEAIFGNPAMINRMSFRFRFSPPTREMLEKRLNQLLRACGHSRLDTDSPLLDRAIRCGINMRQWSAFSLRFVFYKSPIQSMLAGIDQLEKRV